MPPNSNPPAEPRTDARSADPRTERWLRGEAVPVHDAMQTDPGRGLALKDVFGAIRARHARAPAGRS